MAEALLDDGLVISNVLPPAQTCGLHRTGAGSDSNALALTFQDNTSLSFDFAPRFATEAHFSRWKDGNERVLRYWPRIHCEPLF